jgi:hemoglobin
MTRLSFLAATLLASLALALPGIASAADDATFVGLGGKQGIKKIVKDLIPLIQGDSRIKESFKHAKMHHLAMRLEQQFCALSGGPCTYKGKDMATVHKGLNVTAEQFSALAEDLQKAMTMNGVATPIQQALVDKLLPMQPDIVTK